MTSSMNNQPLNFNASIKPTITTNNNGGSGRLLLENTCDFILNDNKSVDGYEQDIVSTKKRRNCCSKPKNKNAGLVSTTDSSRETKIDDGVGNDVEDSLREDGSTATNETQETSTKEVSLESNEMECEKRESLTTSTKDQSNDNQGNSSIVPTDRDVCFNHPTNDNYSAGNQLLQDLLALHRYILKHSASNDNEVAQHAKNVIASFKNNLSHDAQNGKFYAWENDTISWKEIDPETVQDIITKALKDAKDLFSNSQITDIQVKNGELDTFMQGINEPVKGNEKDESDLKVGDYDVIIEDGYYNIFFDHLIYKKLNEGENSSNRVDIALNIVNHIKKTQQEQQGRFLARNPSTNKWYELGYIPCIEFTIKKIWKASNQKNELNTDSSISSSEDMEINESKKTYKVSEISEHDVLFGCDAELTKYHLGNQLYSHLLDKYNDERNKNEESMARKIVVFICKKHSGKFLKFHQETNSCTEIPTKELIDIIKNDLKEKVINDRILQVAKTAKPNQISESKKQKFQRRFSHEIASNEPKKKVQCRNSSKKQRIHRRFSHSDHILSEDTNEVAALEQMNRNDKKRLEQLMNNNQSINDRQSSNDNCTLPKQQPNEEAIKAFLNDSSRYMFTSPIMSKLKDQFMQNLQAQNVNVTPGSITSNSLNMNPMLRNTQSSNTASDSLALSLQMAEMKRRKSLEVATRTTASAQIDPSQLAAVVAARTVAAQHRRYSLGPTAGTQGRRNSLEAIRSIELERRMSVGGALKNRPSSARHKSSVAFYEPEKRSSMRRGSIELMKQSQTNTLAQQIASVKSELEALVSSDSEDEKV